MCGNRTNGTTAPPPARAPRSKQVLLVDDDVGVLKLYGMILAREGIEVLKADSASSALTMLKEKTPDLLILDIMMPGVDGIELCKQVRASTQTADIPVIFLSAKRDPESIQMGFEAGANAYLFKPILPRDLVAKTSSMLRKEVLNPIGQ
jgi:DNA-binding response OmpR family regulator